MDVQNKALEECPKCKSRFGVIISENLKQKKVLCVNGDCDFEMNRSERQLQQAHVMRSVFDEDDEQWDEPEPCATCGDIDGVNPCCAGYDPLHYKNCGYG